jgi:hypothetical protein
MADEVPEVDLLFRGVKLGRVKVDGTFAAHEAPLPVGTALSLGGRLARVVRAVEQGGEGPPGMRLMWEDDEPELEVSDDETAASPESAPAEPGKGKKRKKRR